MAAANATKKVTAQPPPDLDISPPLLNSANPWATTLEDLTDLYQCSSTGAVTTRTALLEGFPHDGKVHRFCLFDSQGFDGVSESSERLRVPVTSTAPSSASAEGMPMKASLNTLGYSYITLDGYLGFIETIAITTKAGSSQDGKGKWFLVSVTGTPAEVAECYNRISALQDKLSSSSTTASTTPRLAMEINLSCPNITGKPPPAYSSESLKEYLTAVTEAMAAKASSGAAVVPWGLKSPPYTFAGQFEGLISALRWSSSAGADGGDEASAYCPVSFVTATNTLGSCIVLTPTGAEDTHQPTLPGLGIGGMAGAPLHPLALGNVATLRRMLDEHPSTSHVRVIGIGGVEDAAGYRRMRDVGASAVGVGTALGRKGVSVFSEIEKGLGKSLL